MLNHELIGVCYGNVGDSETPTPVWVLNPKVAPVNPLPTLPLQEEGSASISDKGRMASSKWISAGLTLVKGLLLWSHDHSRPPLHFKSYLQSPPDLCSRTTKTSG